MQPVRISVHCPTAQSMKKLFRSSIRTRIILLLLLATVSAVTISVSAFIDQRSTAEAYERASLRNAADSMADSYETILLPIATKLALIGQSRYYRSPSGRCRPAIARIVDNSPGVTSSGLIDVRGRILCASGKQKGDTPSSISHSLIREAFSKPDSVISNLEVDPVTGRQFLLLVRAAKNRKGAIFATIGRKTVQDLLRRSRKSDFVAILNSDGSLVASERASLAMPNWPFLDLANLWQTIRSDHDGRPHTIHRGNAVVAYSRTDHNLGYIVTATTSSALYARSVSAFWRNILISISCLLLTAWVAWQTLVEPLARRARILRESAEAVAGGDLTVRTQTSLRHGDELADAGRAFDQMARSLSVRDRALKTLGIASSTAVHAASEKDLLWSMCDVIVKSGGYAAAWVCYLETGKPRVIWPVSWSGKGGESLQDIDLRRNGDCNEGSLLSRCVETGTPQLVHDPASEALAGPWWGLFKQRGHRSALVLPLMISSHPFGALIIHSEETDAFEGVALESLSQMARDLSYGIGVLRARKQQEQDALRLESGLTKAVQALSRAVELRDPFTAGHQERAEKIACAIAREMAMDENQIQGLSLAASIYDIGKLGIPADILSKPGKLSEPEMNLIRGHAEAGRLILQGIDFPWPVAEMVYQHHERVNGSGYPRGLKSGQILVEAKIIAVADVVEAMLSHRPYRESLGLDMALDEIRQGRGTLYDPGAVDACIRLFREKGFKP